MPPFIFPAGASAIGNAVAPSPDYFRILDGVTWNDAYPFGTRTSTASGITGNVLNAGPVFTAAMTLIQDVGFYYSALGGGPTNSKLAIYSNKSTTDPYPDRLLWNSGDIVPVLGINTASPGLATQQNSMLWIVSNRVLGGTGTILIQDTSNSAESNPFGFRQGAGWVAFGSEFSVNFALAYASAFPDPFPSIAGGAAIVGIGSGAQLYRFLWRGF